MPEENDGTTEPTTKKVEIEIEQLPEVNYTEKVDQIIYSSLTDGFDEDDWTQLAFAALDQAGFTPEIITRIKELLNN